MKSRLLSALVLIAASALGLGGMAHAQTQGGSSFEADADDETYEEAFDLLSSMGIINENCKAALEPTYYEGFKVLLRVNYGAMGATNEDVVKQEASTVEFADYLCTDKAACWRATSGLPATATLEEGRAKCMDMMMNGMSQFDDMLGLNDEPAT
jgi:hypothetical protein